MLRAVFELLPRARVALVVALQIPGREQNFALPLGDRALLVAHAAATAAAALRLLEAPLERLHLHHEQIGLHCLLAILRDRVIRDQIAGHELAARRSSPARAELFQPQQRFAVAAASRRRRPARSATRRR